MKKLSTLSMFTALMCLTTGSAYVFAGTAGEGREWSIPPTTIHQHTAISLVKVSPDNSKVLVGMNGKSAVLLDLETLREVQKFESPKPEQMNPLEAFSFSPDGKKIALAYGREISIFDTQSGEKKFALTPHHFHPSAIAFSPDNNLLVTVGGDQNFTVWDLTEAQPGYRAWGHHQGKVKDVAFMPNSEEIVTVADDDFTLVSHLFQKKITHAFSNGVRKNLKQVAVSRDGQTIYTLGDGFEAWNLASGQRTQGFGYYENGYGNPMPQQMAISQDGSVVALGVGEDVHLYSMSTGKKIVELAKVNPKLGSSYVSSLAFSSQGASLVVGTRAGKVFVMDVSRY